MIISVRLRKISPITIVRSFISTPPNLAVETDTVGGCRLCRSPSPYDPVLASKPMGAQESGSPVVQGRARFPSLHSLVCPNDPGPGHSPGGPCRKAYGNHPGGRT